MHSLLRGSRPLLIGERILQKKILILCDIVLLHSLTAVCYLNVTCEMFREDYNSYAVNLEVHYYNTHYIHLLRFNISMTLLCKVHGSF